MNPTRKYFLKLAALFAVVIIVLSIFGIGKPWKLEFWILLAASLVFAVLPIAGRPIHWLWQQYVRFTSQGLRFFQGVALVLFLIALYRFQHAIGGQSLQHALDASAWTAGSRFAWLIPALLFLVIGVIPPLANLLFAGWMKLGFALHVVASRVILTLVWIIAVVPVGVVAKLVGKRFLDRGPDPTLATYWIDREPIPFEKKRYNRHF